MTVVVDGVSADRARLGQVLSKGGSINGVSHAVPEWTLIAERKQQDREAAATRWTKERLDISALYLPPSTTKDVRRWPAASGDLSTRQLTITGSTPTQILKHIAEQQWTAEEVLIAFSICATLAHHLVNPLSDIFFEKGLERARALDHHLQTTGQVVGPLHGLPLSLKDVMNLSGHVTNWGFVALADNIQPTTDTLLTHLHNAGAVFYCKTNVPQSLMSGECNNHLYGRTCTPDNRLLSAGGSSGGEGALIALHGSPLGIGTDIAGSIRTPANFNGIYGLCPTYGRLPCHSAPYSSLGLINAVAGPMSSSLDGLELYTRTVLSFQPWVWDTTCIPLPWNQPLYNQILTRPDLVFAFIPHDSIIHAHPPITRGLLETKSALRAAGHHVLDCPTFFQPDDDLWALAKRIFCADGGASLRSTLALVPEPAIEEISIPPASMALSAAELREEGKQLLKVRQTFLERWRATERETPTGRPVDVFVLPSGGTVAPPHGTMGYFLYEAVSNVLNWTCGTVPVGRVDVVKDRKVGGGGGVGGEGFVPLNEEDGRNWERYSPEAYENGAICLQVMGPMYSEEVVLACMRVIDRALGRGEDHVL